MEEGDGELRPGAINLLWLMISPLLIKRSRDVERFNAEDPLKCAPWTDGRGYRHQQASIELHQEILDFARWISPTEAERRQRVHIIGKFRNAVRILWPGAKLIPIGSSSTNTYLPDGDIDFALIYNVKNSDAHLFEQLLSHLKSQKVLKTGRVISAQVPIIKGVEFSYGYSVDISINNVNGVLKIPRIKNSLDAYPALYPILMVLKVFTWERHLDEPYTGGISSNSLEQMVIFVLQQIPPESTLNLGDILIEFFRIFGTQFNYTTVGFTTVDGGCVFEKINRVHWNRPVALTIEDPQIRCRYIGENSFKIHIIRQCFKFSLQRLLDMKRDGEVGFLHRIITNIDGLVQRRKFLQANSQ